MEREREMDLERRPVTSSRGVRRGNASKSAARGEEVRNPDRAQVAELGTGDVDESLGRAAEQAMELEQRAQSLQTHFQQAQASMVEIGKLCDEADVTVRKSQALLNRSAQRINDLNERARHLLLGAGEEDGIEPPQPADSGPAADSRGGKGLQGRPGRR
mmetsp:Transcript_134439/g.287622  ORF Transcript_134439/g.287622 Transcript_134439/m.287622 type:complete len:159 (+) Transcript_134439:61-537(+)